MYWIRQLYEQTTRFEFCKTCGKWVPFLLYTPEQGRCKKCCDTPTSQPEKSGK